MEKSICIIGGGASGLTAAIFAARQSNCKVFILEKQDRVGKKILTTGNGRCNLTNKNISASNYFLVDKRFIESVINKFGYNETCSFFEDLGIMCVTHEDGKTYPRSYQASSVLDTLRLEASRLNVEEICNTQVKAVVKKQNYFHIEASSGNYKANAVIIAVGGVSNAKEGSSILTGFGHSCTKIFPAIVQMKSPSPFVKALNGIKFEGAATLKLNGKSVRTERGEILFTEYGFSGPPVMQLSGTAGEYFLHRKNSNITLSLNLMPDFEKNKLRDVIISRIKHFAYTGRTVEHFFTGMINKKIGLMLLKQLELLPAAKKVSELSSADAEAISDSLQNWSFEITGTMPFSNAQVTGGGIPCSEFHLSMESKLIKGLYATGEVLELYGDCGGYNLQWAWASGAIAGENCARAFL